MLEIPLVQGSLRIYTVKNTPSFDTSIDAWEWVWGDWFSSITIHQHWMDCRWLPLTLGVGIPLTCDEHLSTISWNPSDSAWDTTQNTWEGDENFFFLQKFLSEQKWKSDILVKTLLEMCVTLFYKYIYGKRAFIVPEHLEQSTSAATFQSHRSSITFSKSPTTSHKIVGNQS